MTPIAFGATGWDCPAMHAAADGDREGADEGEMVCAAQQGVARPPLARAPARSAWSAAWRTAACASVMTGACRCQMARWRSAIRARWASNAAVVSLQRA